MSSQTIKIQMVMDLVCPWCFLGKRKLDKAIATFHSKAKKNSTPVQFEIEYFPYQLLPNAPKVSILKSDSYKERFGEKQAKQMINHMIELGKQDGIAFNYSGKIGNTMDAHRLIYYAQEQSKQDKVVENLFKSYFELAQDITDKDVLINIAEQSGLGKEKVSEFLTSSQGTKQVQTLLRKKQVPNGVPEFTIGEQHHFSGAQNPDMFVHTFEKLVKSQH